MGINIPFHSAIEVFGSCAAITAAMVMVFLRQNRRSASHSVWVASGLLAMGILDVFHGAVPLGNSFVWLHSMASLVGAFFFMLVWLPPRGDQAAIAQIVIVALVTALFGGFSVSYAEALPAMLEQGEFTHAASVINLAAGLFFLVAAPAFLNGYRKGGSKDDLLFFIVALLFGAAELLFQYSKAWDSTWWAWHYLRLAALTVVMIYVFVLFKRFNSSVVTEALTRIAAVANEIAATIVQHERTAGQQAAAASETSATIEELSASAEQSSQQAASAAALAEEAGQTTVEGGEAIRQALAAMNGLRNKMSAMAEHTLRLGEQIAQIGGIATLVKDLSAEINMLALNAAVEAARAGEHGKGFAVVASEVRKLAIESKKSADQASTLVTEVQKTANTSIMMTEEGARTVAEIAELAGQVGELFDNLAGMAVGVNENSQQVVLNARQQAAAFKQVVDAANSIAAGANETADGIGQTKIGVLKLNEAAENLQAIV